MRNVPLVVVDLDASPMSRDIVSRLSAVATVRIGGSASAVGEASGALAAGQIAGIVVVPENFSRDAARGTPTAVTVFGTGAYPVQDKAVLGSVGAVVQGVAGEVTLRAWPARALRPPPCCNRRAPDRRSSISRCTT